MANSAIAPKRVLHILVTLNLGGAESRTMDLFRNQNKQVLEHDFLVMTTDKCYYTEEVLAAGGKIHVVSNPRTNLLKHIKDLYRLLRKEPRYDAIHAHTSFHGGLCLMIASFAGVKARISHARNLNTSTPSVFFGAMLALGRFAINHYATARFASSKPAGDYLFGDNARFTVVPDAFNYQNVLHKSDISEAQRLDIVGHEGVHFVAVARFYTVKNHAFMVDVFKEISALRDDVYMHFIGDGELKEQIEALVIAKGLSKNVKFWGKRDDVYQILPCFDIMLMPSITEGLGGAALEAQKAGLPCLISDTIPLEADIGLGLCKRLSLQLPASTWAQAGISLIDITSPTKGCLDAAFENKGFSLAHSEKTFLEAYCLNE